MRGFSSRSARCGAHDVPRAPQAIADEWEVLPHLVADRRGSFCRVSTSKQILDVWLTELDERNVDNVSRTQSYLELYTYTREHGPELPWLFMAHLVSRNAGYTMTDLARALDDERTPREGSMREAIFSFMAMFERANYLIFYDAWFHVLHHLCGRSAELPVGRTPTFVREAWPRYETAARVGVDAGLERSLVLDLVHNEQHFIEHRVVHNPRYRAGQQLLAMMESSGREKPLVFPVGDAQIRVGQFADLQRRIATGAVIFDEVLADRAQRDAAWEWAMQHPHTGARVVHGGRGYRTLREAWPVERVRELFEGIHAPPEPDPLYP
jgi:hypothetical protein